MTAKGSGLTAKDKHSGYDNCDISGSYKTVNPGADSRVLNRGLKPLQRTFGCKNTSTMTI